MGEMIQLRAADGHELDAYVARPAGKPRAGLVVLQEIFGVNGHIRNVTDNFAQRGFLVIAPALFDRVGPNIELGYTDFEKARKTMGKLDLDEVTHDVAAAVTAARQDCKVGAVGYCWGGAIADLAACRTEVDAAVSYYGRATVNWLTEQPRVPVLYHFGGKDPLIPADMVEQIRAGRPGHTIHVYPEANHGFNCDERHEFHPASAELALGRTLAFFEQHLA